MDSTLGAGMLPGNESVVKAHQQRAGSADFWGKVDWTKEENLKTKTLAPANEARDLVLGDAPGEKTSKLRRLMNTKRFRAKALSAKGVEGLDATTLQIQIKDAIDLAETQKSKMEARDSTSNKTISYLNDCVEFVGQFSGIIEIMKGADQGYGGAGYTAVSFLLAVVVNTKKKDDLVAEAMLDLKNEYSRMVLISELYPTPRMMSYIATVYKLGIEFVQDAAVYFARPTSRRLLEAIWKPPYLVNRKVKEISDAMTQIFKERDTLLNETVHMMKNQVGDLQTAVDELSQDLQQVKIDMAGLHANRETERLTILSNELSTHSIQPEKTVGEYPALLDSSFDHPPGLVRFSLDMLTSQKTYKAWESSRKSCMLVLNGSTRADQTSLCWLSPASIALAAALRQEARDSSDGSRVAVAEFYGQITDLMSGTVKPTSVVVCLLLQLLKADSALLRDADKFEALRARLTKVDRKYFSEYDQILDLFVEIMEKFDLVYIIIDRVDRISGNFMQQFLKNAMLRCTKAKVRTFCVASRSQDIDTEIAKLSDREETHFMSLRMDQD